MRSNRYNFLVALALGHLILRVVPVGIAVTLGVLFGLPIVVVLIIGLAVGARSFNLRGKRR
jgi:hypothetical protein